MLIIGSDHGGYELKEQICDFLEGKNIKFNDLGTYSTDSVDYPDIAKQVCQDVVKSQGKGILICGTGIGMSMAANKVKGIRAALCANIYDSKMARKHNNANVLCLGGRVIGKELAFHIVEVFLNTQFESGRHKRRVNKIMEIEKD